MRPRKLWQPNWLACHPLACPTSIGIHLPCTQASKLSPIDSLFVANIPHVGGPSPILSGCVAGQLRLTRSRRKDNRHHLGVPPSHRRKTQALPAILRPAAHHAWISRWAVHLSTAAIRAFASSLLHFPASTSTSSTNIDGPPHPATRPLGLCTSGGWPV